MKLIEQSFYLTFTLLFVVYQVNKIRKTIHLHVAQIIFNYVIMMTIIATSYRHLLWTTNKR